MDRQRTGLVDMPVELLYKVQLDALSYTLPHVCRRLYRIFKSAPSSFQAEYILGRILADRTGKIVTKALRYPLCTLEVFSALCRLTDSDSLSGIVPQLPRRLFRNLQVPNPGSEWTEHDHPLPLLKYLFNHPSIPAPVDDFYRYELEKASQACFLPLISFLLDHRTRGERRPLLWAAREGLEAVVRLMLADDGINVNVRDSRRLTPLCLAAMYGHEEVVQALLARDDIDVNSKDEDGRTPLRLAAGYGYGGVVRLLLARDDIDVGLKDVYGRSPLCLAVLGGCEGVVRLLLARNDVDVNSKDVDGSTPLSSAAIGGRKEIVGLLLARDDIRVDVNLMGILGWEV